MNKIYQLIYLQGNKVKLLNTLLVHNISCFGIGSHILAVNDKPQGVNIPTNFKGVDLAKVMKSSDISKVMHSAHATVLSFNSNNMKALKQCFAKQYIFIKQSNSSMTFKSRTQHANFTIHKNGKIRTSKDLQDIDLLYNIVRIMNHKKPIDPTDAL